MNDSRLALVTGAQQGIGAAAALALGRAGYNVLVNYFDDEQAARLCEGCDINLFDLSFFAQHDEKLYAADENLVAELAVDNIMKRSNSRIIGDGDDTVSNGLSAFFGGNTRDSADGEEFVTINRDPYRVIGGIICSFLVLCCSQPGPTHQQNDNTSRKDGAPTMQFDQHARKLPRKIRASLAGNCGQSSNPTLRRQGGVSVRFR